MNAVPFEFDSTFCGLVSSKGLLRDEGNHLCLEFQQFLGDLFRGRVQTVRIPLTDIATVNFYCSRFGRWSRIELRSNRLEPFANVPSSSQGKVTLYIRRKDRDAARALFDGLHVPVNKEST